MAHGQRVLHLDLPLRIAQHRARTANTLAAADDTGRERPCRSITRPHFTLGRLLRLRDGKLAYRVKKASRLALPFGGLPRVEARASLRGSGGLARTARFRETFPNSIFGPAVDRAILPFDEKKMRDRDETSLSTTSADKPMKTLAALCSSVLLLLCSVVACTNEESLGGRDGQTSGNADAGSNTAEAEGGSSAPDGGTDTSGKSKVERYCSAKCVQDANCTTKRRSAG